jgi:PAS domain S-box-containing protein
MMVNSIVEEKAEVSAQFFAHLLQNMSSGLIVIDENGIVASANQTAASLLGYDLDEMIENYPYNTISGLILHELRSIPSAGEHLDWMNFRIEVMDMDGKRVDKILVAEVAEASSAPGQDQESPEKHPDA